METADEIPLARRVVWVSAVRMGLLAAWFGTTTIAAARLGKSAFALYGLCLVAIRIGSEAVGEPLDAGVMRDVPVLPADDRLRVFWSAMWIRVGLGGMGLLAAVTKPGWSSRLCFNRPDLTQLAVLSAAGVLGDLVLRGVLGFLQASGRFHRFLIVDAVWQLGRVTAVVVLMTTGRLTATTLVVIYVAMPYAAAALGFGLIGARVSGPSRGAVFRLFHYAKWIAVGLGVGALFERLDVWLLSRFRGPSDVGLYFMALLLASIPDYVNGIVQTTLTPRVPIALASGTFGRLSRRFWAIAVPAGVVMLVAAIGLSGWAIPEFLPDYAAAVPAFRILIVMSTINLIVTPLATAAVTFAAPRAATAISVVGLATVAGVGLIVIPTHGVIGAAAAIAAAKAVVAGSTLVTAIRMSGKSRGADV